MKKAVIITAVLLLIAGTGVLWKIRENRLAAKAAYLEAKATEGQAYNKELTPSKYDVGPPDAQEMLELVNKERTKVGAAPLKLDERLNASAQEKADDMQNRDYYGHKSPDGIEGFSLVFKHMPGKCRYASENLAILLVSISNSREAIDGWMSSTKGHREAILDKKYDLVGFGVAKNKYGNSLVVQHFCELNK